MNNNKLIKIIEEFNSKNILLTLSKNEIDDDLLTYFNNSKTKVTIITEGIRDINKENTTIKNSTLSDELLFRNDFDLVILNNFNIELMEQIKVIEKYFSKFPLTVVYCEKIERYGSLINQLNSYKLNNKFSLSIKTFLSDTNFILLYENDEKINKKFEMFLENNCDSSFFILNNTSKLDKNNNNEFIKLMDEISNNNNISNTPLNNLKDEINISNDLSDKILSKIYETQYFNNHYRSISNRINSFFYPFSLLRHNNLLGGLKNALLTIKAMPLLKKHDTFDVGYYIQQKPEILYDGIDVYLHYIYHGAKEGLKPNKIFDGKDYLKFNPDLKNIKLNPLVHYILYGKAENRPRTEEEKLKFALASGSNKTIKGSFQTSFTGNVVEGWIAEIGNNYPLKAKIVIDDESIEIIADIYRPDLKQNGINEGKHGFKVNVPKKFIDGIEHEVQLKTMEDKLISTIRHKWDRPNYENNIQRYLSYSMTSPVLSVPFTDADKKILSVMENIANYLSMQVPPDKPLVSIIMPVYNRVDLIANSIQSVLKQNYDNFELIIVDDGSTDGTFNEINKFDDDRIHLYKNHENMGVSYSRNRGLEESRGRYIMYLDSDNDWDERYVESMLGAFNLNKDADAIYCGQLIYRESRSNLESIRFGTFNKGLVSNKNYIDLNAYAHTRSLYEKYGGFDEELKRFVDWDLILKYSIYGKTYSVPILLSNYYYNLADNAISDDVSLADTLKIIPGKYKQRLKKYNRDINLKYGVSVIIPSYESLDDLKECLDSLFKVKSELLEIIVVDNNSCENVKNYLKDLESENKIKLILNNTNLGFTYAVNQGIELSNEKNDILLLNNDAVVTENSIELLQKAAYQLDDCAMTVPQQVLPPKTNTINVHVPFATENNEIDVNLSYYHRNIINLPLFHNGEYTELSFAPFFCVYIKRDVYDQSLGLDARLGRHYYSDMIFCNYVREIMGKKIFHVADARVYHKLQKSTKALEKKSIAQHNLLLRENKWSKEEQDKYGFKPARWDVEEKEILENEIKIREYSSKQVEDILSAMKNQKTIILPIYNAFEETRKCIKSVLENTRGNYELLLINDCSTDSRIRTYIHRFKDYDNIRIIDNKTNKGFVATANIGLKNSLNDVILLNSDTIVTKNWLNKLIISAYQENDIATVTAVSNNAGAFSVPERSKSNTLPNNLKIYQMSKIVEENSDKTLISTPTGNGFCMYIKRNVINDIGLFDEETFGRGYGEENDFCMRAKKKGWKHVVDDSVYVYHKANSSFKDETKELLPDHLKILESKYPSYPKEVQQFIKSYEFNNSCSRLKNTLENLQKDKKYKKILFVLHEGIGGSVYFTETLISRISKFYDCYLLISSGSEITLKHYQNGSLKLLNSWNTNVQWHVDYYYMKPFKKIYFNVLTSLNVDLIHIQHLVKHSFDLFELIKEFEIPYLVNLHDYYYICPSLNLLNDKNTYCAGKCNSTGQCDLPLPSLNNAPVLNKIEKSWRKINEELLNKAEKLIAPTNYVKEVYSENYPDVSSKIDVICHGQNFTKNKEKINDIRDNGEKIRIVIPGNIGISKGALLFKQIKEYDVNSRIEFHFLGLIHESITKKEGVIHGPYRHEDYPKLIEEINPLFTGIFSIWPETFSYTLSESWNLNIPVIATDIGALNERITDGKNGWLVDLDARLIYEKIIEVSENKKEYENVLNNTKNIKIRTLDEMIKDYEMIYSELIHE